jgi:hypothetical protein
MSRAPKPFNLQIMPCFFLFFATLVRPPKQQMGYFLSLSVRLPRTANEQSSQAVQSPDHVVLLPSSSFFATLVQPPKQQMGYFLSLSIRVLL